MWPNNFHQSDFYLITKTRLYNFDPLKPHFYIVKLGFTGIYIIFLISAQKHRLWVFVRTALARQFYRVPTIYVLSRSMKNIRIFIWKFSYLWWWNFQYIWIGVFSCCYEETLTLIDISFMKTMKSLVKLKNTLLPQQLKWHTLRKQACSNI